MKKLSGSPPGIFAPRNFLRFPLLVSSARVSFTLVAFALACLCPTRSLALNGTVSTVTFTGPITGKTINFSLYLPPGYTGGTQEYPVVYHLHGINGTHNGNQISTVPASHEAAVAAGVIAPVIIVFPDGYTNAFWADSFDGVKPAETNVVSEILPYVDSNYRTLASRDWRAMQGFSMGGFGAAKFAAKFPDKFCVGVIYDGALLTWAQIQAQHASVASSVFNNSQTYFNQYSPWHWVTQNAATLAANVPFRQAVGSLLDHNRAFRDHLLAHGITPEYLETGCGHVLDCLLTSAGRASWALIAASFGASTTTTPFTGIAAEDGWVLESTETSSTGGTIDNVGGLLLGDDASDRQYKVVLSFDTSALPDTATIVSATLKLKRASVVGTNPFTTHGTAHVDIRNGGFGGSTMLATGDWQTAATSTQVAALSNPTTNGALATGALNAAGLSAISKTGKTQLRVYFATGDNDDVGNDTLSFYSANSGTASNRPVLEVVYR